MKRASVGQLAHENAVLKQKYNDLLYHCQCLQEKIEEMSENTPSHHYSYHHKLHDLSGIELPVQDLSGVYDMSPENRAIIIRPPPIRPIHPIYPPHMRDLHVPSHPEHPHEHGERCFGYPYYGGYYGGYYNPYYNPYYNSYNPYNPYSSGNNYRDL